MSGSKKDIELWRLERFKTFIADFPNGTIESTEEPDFLVRTQGWTVGIELTDLHRETPTGEIPQQASEAMRRRVIARAQALYNAGNHPPVLASFFLHDSIHIKKDEVEPLAEDLANLVIANLPEPSSRADVPKDWDDTQPRPSILQSLSINRLDAVTRTFFSSPSATWVATLTREDIERALSSKELKCTTYRTKCDEAWLVINADIESIATWFEFDPEDIKFPFITQFDRVFLVQHFAGKVYELSAQGSGTRS